MTITGAEMTDDISVSVPDCSTVTVCAMLTAACRRTQRAAVSEGRLTDICSPILITTAPKHTQAHSTPLTFIVRTQTFLGISPFVLQIIIYKMGTAFLFLGELTLTGKHQPHYLVALVVIRQ